MTLDGVSKGDGAYVDLLGGRTRDVEEALGEKANGL